MKPAQFAKILSMAAVPLFVTMTAQAAPSRMTQNFVTNAVIGNKLEIETGLRALDKSRNSAVRTFAQKMVGDHRDAEQKLEDCLKQEKLSGLMPTSYDRKHKALRD